MKEVDFFRFERDPRALLLAMLIKREKNKIELSERGAEKEKSLQILKKALLYVSRLKQISPQAIDMATVIATIDQLKQGKNLLEILMSQLTESQRRLIEKGK